MNEPRVRAVLEVLCGAQAKGLARVASVGRVCGEQQGLHSNKSFAFHGKLWERGENGR